MFSIDATETTSGVDQIEQKLDAISEVARDGSALWPKVGEVFAEHQTRIFASGSDWAPLDEDTVRIKGSAEVLIDNRTLVKAATSPTPVEATSLYAKFGVRHAEVPYAHWHARGAGVPRRDPVPPMPQSVKTMILETVAERVREELNR
jgi:hypothetical protein